MNENIRILINGTRQSSSDITVVKETDEIVLSIKASDAVLNPVFEFEDYNVPAMLVTLDGEDYYVTLPKQYFRDCFGSAVVRIVYESEVVSLAFNVLAKKTSADQARKMISYLASKSATLIQSCLARTAIPVGVIASDAVEPETLLACAESVLDLLQASRQELMANCRQRLVPKRLPLHQARMWSYEIDPVDVLSNLDALKPTGNIGDVLINARQFDLTDMYVEALQPTANVFENRVLLGGLYSIRRKLGGLQQLLADHPTSSDGSPAGYESFTHLLLSITASGMTRRCSNAIDVSEGLIDLFERKLGVQHKGDLVPVMTPFVRSTRVYRTLYTQLAVWYEIGSPSIGNIGFLLKLKSLAKLYELFALSHLIEYLSDQSWESIGFVEHPEFGHYLPKQVSFTRENERLTLDYEQKIVRHNGQTGDQDLVDVFHMPSSKYPYWTPDYVLRWEFLGITRYMILDAKYSNASSVREYALPDLYRKYFEGTAVYDQAQQVASSAAITAVIAIYALEWGSGTYLSKWPHQGIFSALPRMPSVGGIGLMLENASFFSKAMDRLFDLTYRSAGQGAKPFAPMTDRMMIVAA